MAGFPATRAAFVESYGDESTINEVTAQLLEASEHSARATRKIEDEIWDAFDAKETGVVEPPVAGVPLLGVRGPIDLPMGRIGSGYLAVMKDYLDATAESTAIIDSLIDSASPSAPGQPPSLGYLSYMRLVGRHLCIQQSVALHEGDVPGFVDHTRRLFAAGALLRDSPTLRAIHIRIANEVLAVNEIHRAFDLGMLDTAQATALAEILLDVDYGETIEYGLLGDSLFRLLGIPSDNHWGQFRERYLYGVVGQPFYHGLTDVSRDLLAFLGRVTGDMDGQRARVLETGLELWEARRISPGARRDARDAIRSRLANEPTWRSGVTLFELSEYDHARYETEHHLAGIRILATRLALFAYAGAHEGARPDTLEALIPTCLDRLPTDPANGEPLYYRNDPSNGEVVLDRAVLIDKKGSRK